MANTKRDWEKRKKYSWAQRMKGVRKAKRVKDKITRDENTNYNNNVSDGDNCVSNSDEAYDCSALDLSIKVWDGIVQFDDLSSIPTVGAVNIPEEIRDSESPLPDEIRDSESPLPDEIRDSESTCSVISILDGLFDDESMKNLCDGIVLESPSIPTVGAVKIPEEIRYRGSPDSGVKVSSDSAVSVSSDSPVKLPQEIRDCGSCDSSIEIVSEYHDSGDEDDLSVIYESYASKINIKPYDPPFSESHASQINKKLVLSEEFNIFDNISQGNNACNSSGQSVRWVNPEFVCVMNPKIKYICQSGPTQYLKNQKICLVCVSCTLLINRTSLWS